MPTSRHSVKKPAKKQPRPATARREKVIDVAARLQAFEQKLKSGKPVNVTTLVRESVYTIKPLKWHRGSEAKTVFGYYRVYSTDHKGRWLAYGCRRLPWQTYSMLGKHRTLEGAKAICERVYRQQLRKALIEVND